MFPKIQVHDNVVLRDGGNIAWAVRKDSPQLLAVLNNFVKMNRQGTTLCMVTHDPRYADMTSRKLHLLDGRILDADGAPLQQSQPLRQVAP